MKRRLLAAFAAACVACAPARAQVLTVEDLLRPPAYASPTISPNGRHFAVTVPAGDRLNLAVIDMETRQATALTSFKTFDVVGVRWVGNDYLVFSLGKYGASSSGSDNESGGLYMVSRDGKQSRKLADNVQELQGKGQYLDRGFRLYETLPDSDEEILATGRTRDADAVDLYRLNVRTGRAELVTLDRPARAREWVLDRNRVPRIVITSIKDTLDYIVWYRPDAASPWTELVRYDSRNGIPFVPLHFDDDNRTLFVAAAERRDTMAIFRYDPQEKKFIEQVAAHPRFDMGADARGDAAPGLITGWKTGKVLGFSVAADKPQTVWIDPAYARIQKMLDQALPDTVNTFRRSPDGSRVLVRSFSDRHPSRWYLFDEQKKTLEELFASRPWLKPEQLVEMRPFVLKTRDGLEIPSYYFLPKNHRPGDKLPTILHIHGGPFARADEWGDFSFGAMEAQLFASRGYAVVLPNFRITPGFGKRIYAKGFGSYGRQMIDDHVDAARWAIAEGFADPARICISGVSYGASAVLMSMAAAPDVFKCGVAGAIAADKKMQLSTPTSGVANSKGGISLWLRVIGAESIAAIPPHASPVNLADRVKGAVMLYAGAEDFVTPIEQTRAMIRALEKAGNPPKKVIIKGEEGHGFGKLDNNVELYGEILKFLDENIGAKSLN